jgi:hypothetical protein
MQIFERVIKLNIFVFEEIEYFPLTGIYSIEEDIKSALTNRAIFTSNKDIRQQITTSIGGFNYNLIEGTSDKHWDGGVISECNFKDVHLKKDSVYPIVNTGTYTLFDKSRKLYSDESYVKVLDTEVHVSLANGLKRETIEVSVFKRDSNFNNIKFLQYHEDEDSDYRFQYNESENSIVLYNSYSIGKYVEDEFLSADFISTFGEYKFFGNETKRLIYSNYFPLNENKVRLFSIDRYTKEIRIWHKVNNFLNHAPEELDCYYVIPEKGLIVTSGTSVDKEKDFFVKESFYDNENNLVSLIFFDNIFDWDFQGLVKIGESIYKYTERKDNSLNQLILLHGDPVQSVESVKYFHLYNNTKLTEKFYLLYEICPRLDAEIENANRIEYELDLNPLKLSKQYGILQISPYEKHVNNIELLCLNKNKNESDIYESLCLGTDYLDLQATCYNTAGNKVKDVLVTFEVLDEDINLLFQGESKQITVNSNYFGDSKTKVIAPYDDSFMFITVGLDQVQGKEIYINNPKFKFGGNLFSLFAILKYNGIEKIDNPEIYLNNLTLDATTDENKYPLVERLLYKQIDDRFILLQPISYLNNRLQFNDNLLFGDMIWKYKIYFNRICRIRAKCIDPGSGNTIYSNIIKINLDLPQHMKGSKSLSDSFINGLRFKKKNSNNDEYNFATGLGGANYITIEPTGLTSAISLRIK